MTPRPGNSARRGASVRLVQAGVTDVGRVRATNQDDYGSVGGLHVLADGMGGHRGGEVASAEAVSATLTGFVDHTRLGLAMAVLGANRAILERAAGDPHVSGMGTTICAIAVVTAEDGGGALAVANVGDSRVYRYTDSRLEQVSHDHSLVADLVRAGELSAEEAARHPQRNILTRALGIEADLVVDTWELVPVVDDRYLLCSDGLVNELDDPQIAEILESHADPEAAAVALVREAVDAGGHDNVTVVVVDVVDAPVPDLGADGLGLPAVRPERLPAAGLPASGSFDSAPAWRAVVFAVALAGLLGAVVGAIGIYARSGWFVGLQDDSVAVFRGRPSGILWFDPTLAERADLHLLDLADVDRSMVIDAIEVDSLEEARRVVGQLAQRAR